MSNNTRLAELMNYITVDTTSGTQLQVSGGVKQTAVTSAILKASSTGVLSAATAGTDYLTSVGISNLTATGTPSSTTYLRGDNTWATIVTSGGTVTSVGLSMPSAFTVASSPITGSGTLTVTGAGTAAQYIAGDGSLITFPTSIANASQLTTLGRNSTGVTLYRGTIVYISGSTGNLPNFTKSQANGEGTSARTFGVIMDDIPNNSDGYVVTNGSISNLDTRSTATNPFTSDTLADGDTVYLDPTTAGYVTKTKPSAPNHLVYIGKVIRTSPTNGTIVYQIQNGYELDEIHDVQVGSYVNKDILYRDTATNLWKNASVATVLGYTPYNATNPSSYIALISLSSTATGLTYTNTTGVFSLTSGYAIPTTTSATNWDTAYTNRITSLTTTGSSGAATLTTNTLNIPNYTLSGLGGQASSTNLTSLSGLTYASTSFVKMTAAGTFALDTTAYTANTGTVTSVAALTLGTTGTDLSSSVANGTTTAVITLNVPTASATNRGALSSTDWSTFNGKQAAINGTGFVKASGTTISYDNSTYLTTTSASSTYLPLAGGTMSGLITSTSTEAFKLAVNSGYISGWNTGATTRYGYLQFASGSLNLASEAGATLNFSVGGVTRLAVTTDNNATLTGNLTVVDGLGDAAGGMKIITHSVTKVGGSKFVKITPGANNYFTGFIFGYNFDNYPPTSATSTGAGFSYQFGGYSDASGACGSKYFDLLWFGGNNVGNLGTELNTDGNGYIITTPTSTGAGGFRASATIMLFARNMSTMSFTYY